MTREKHLKQRVRARMGKTGESYTAARRKVVAAAPQPAPVPSRQAPISGVHPETTALRILLAQAGGGLAGAAGPPSEAMVFGIAGGIGAGVFAFHYPKEDFQNFYLAGRHLWQDNLAYLKAACGRLGVEPEIREAGGAKAAEKHLRDALATGGPVAAWVDMAPLQYRGAPATMAGMGYHLVIVDAIDEQAGTARVRDLAPEPVAVPLADLAAARARIKKQKNRLLSLKNTAAPVDPAVAIRNGLRACHAAARGGRMKNFTLDAFAEWAARIHGSQGKQSWATIFPPGRALWRGLSCAYLYISWYGSGGGLMRPLFAQFLVEAGDLLGESWMRELSRHYAALGSDWQALAEAALPDGVPILRETKTLIAARESALRRGGTAAPPKIRAAWSRLDEIAEQMRTDFPLAPGDADHLLADLQGRIAAIHEQEIAGWEALGAGLG
ncbi:MAG: BtrH N-terminal domain-containing protein [bacterium]